MNTTETKKAAQELAASERRYGTLVEIMNEGVIVLDAGGAIVYVNDRLCEMLGCRRDAMLGRAARVLLNEQNRTVLDEQLIRRSKGESCEYELEIPRADGRRVSAAISARPLYDELGRYDGSFGVVLDNTAKKEAESFLIAQRDLSIALSGVSDLHQALQLSMDTALQVSRMDAAAVYLVDGTRGSEAVLHERLSDELMSQITHFSNGLPFKELMLKGERSYFAPGDPALSHQLDRVARVAGVRALAFMPVRLQGGVVAAFCLVSYSSEHISIQTRRALESIAAQIGTAVARIRAESALRESEERYRLLAENSMTGIYTHQNGVFTYVNERLAQMLGYSSDELIGKHFWTFVDPADREAVKKRGLAISRGEHLTPHVEFRVVCKNGEKKWFQVLSTPVTHQGRTANMGNVADITERKDAEEKIRQSLREKEVLLREVHHRVKNNLAVINSLLGLQSECAEDEAQRRPLLELQNRVRSMALAHEFLYQSDNLAAISVRDYVLSLINHLSLSLSRLGNPVEFKTDIQDIPFDLDTAIPFGFLLTELISNCLKHAFPHGGRGQVRTTLRPLDQDHFELIVQDNGVGIPEQISLVSPQSLGLELVNTFVRQLKGTIAYSINQGTCVTIKFREIKKKSPLTGGPVPVPGG